MSVVARFVGASAFINSIWFLLALPNYTTDAAALVVGTVALYGQGILFVLGLWVARRFGATPARLSWRTFAGVALGQPMIVIASGFFVVYVNRHSDPSLATGVYLLASVLGGALVAVCLRWDTCVWAPWSAVAMLFFTAAWAVVPIAISRGWDAGVIHAGVLGQGSNRVWHPFVTALWQIPMAALVTSWLVGVSQPAKISGPSP